MKQFLKTFDLFGVKANIYTATNQKEYKSIAGAFTSLTIIGISAYVLIISVRALFSKTEPFIIQNQNIKQDPRVKKNRYEYEDNALFVMVSEAAIGNEILYNPNTYSLLYGELQLIETEMISVSEIKKTVHAIEAPPCSQIENLDELGELNNIDKQQIQVAKIHGWCMTGKLFREKYGRKLALQGQPGSSVYSTILALIRFCEPQKVDYLFEDFKKKGTIADFTPQCRETYQVPLTLDGKPDFNFEIANTFSISFPTYQQIHSEEYPLKYQNRDLKLLGIRPVIQIYNYNFNYTTITDFYQGFGRKEETISSLDYSFKTDTESLAQDQLGTDADQYLAKANFYLNEVEKETIRTYSNILQVLANVGALYNGLVTVCSLFFSFVYTFTHEYQNTFDYFDVKPEPDKQQKTFPQDQFQSVFSSKKKEYDIFFIIKYLKNKSNQGLENGKEIMTQILGVEQLAENFYDIQMLKHVLLNKQQKHMLKYIRRPKVFPSQTKQGIEQQTVKEEQSELINQFEAALVRQKPIEDQNLAFEAFRKLKQDGNLVDQNILNLLEDQVQDLLSKRYDEVEQEKSINISLTLFYQIHQFNQVIPKNTYNHSMRIFNLSNED